MHSFLCSFIEYWSAAQLASRPASYVVSSKRYYSPASALDGFSNLSMFVEFLQKLTEEP
jgi:hypothetical protein